MTIPRECAPAPWQCDMKARRRPLAQGLVNVVSGFGLEAGKPLASSNRIAKLAFTGEATTGRLIMQYASQNLIPARERGWRYASNALKPASPRH
jgi:aldehyde dehydrogenase